MHKYKFGYTNKHTFILTHEERKCSLSRRNSEEYDIMIAVIRLVFYDTVYGIGLGPSSFSSIAYSTSLFMYVRNFVDFNVSDAFF